MPITPLTSLWEIRLPSLREEIDKIFEDFFGKVEFPTFREESRVPPIDIYETENEVILYIDLPSIDPKEVSISVVGDKLTIRGERKRDEELREEYPYKKERFFGPFQRTVRLPAEVAADRAKAVYKEGVLKITIPKSEKIGPKEIRVVVE